MFGNFAEFERLDMRERFRFMKAWNRSQTGPRTGTHDHICTTQVTRGAVRECDLQRSRAYELSCSQNKLCSSFAVVLQIHLVQAPHHLALALTHARHVNGEAVMSNAEFFASAEVGGDLRTVDDVLAWQASDVRARSANVLAVDDGDTLSFSRKGPRGEGRPCAATENHEIKLFQLRLFGTLRSRRTFRALHATFLLLSTPVSPTIQPAMARPISSGESSWR